MDLKKEVAIQAAPVPVDQTSLRSFLGLAGYYWKFIKYFAEISTTLYLATSRIANFYWNDTMQVAFEK